MLFWAGYALGVVAGGATVVLWALCANAGRLRDEDRVDDWSEYAAMLKRQRQARSGK